MTILQRNIIIIAAIFAASLVVLAFALPRLANAAVISQSLDLGDSNADVTSLQVYLASNPAWYPEGLTTGYFGALTQKAVQRFQVAQEIVTSGTPETTGYGRVGPATRARINALMGGGSGTPITWDTVPVLSAPSVYTTSTGVTINWTTNEATSGQVYWSVSPIQSDEATGPHQQPYVSGTLAADASGLQTNHSVTISNLAPNTQYNYLVRSTDSVGNMSMLMPSTFRTNN